MIPMLLLSLLLAQTASPPHDLVTRFYSKYVKLDTSDSFFKGSAKRVLFPFLTTRLRRVLDDAGACQADWVRQQPKGSTDKPPFVDGLFFSTMPDGLPTSFTLGPIEALPHGRYKVTVDFVRKEIADLITWRDIVIVAKDGDRFAIDDVVSDADSSTDGERRLSESFDGCRGRRWIGGL